VTEQKFPAGPGEATEIHHDTHLSREIQKWLSTKKNVHHGDPRPDILSHWRQLLSLPIPCHIHWPRFCSRRPARTVAICRKPGFRGSRCVHARTCVLGPCLHVGCARAACVGGESPGNGVGAGGLCLTPRVGCVRFTFVGCCSWVGVWEACRHGVFQLCGVRCAWTLGLVRRLVDLSGLLLRWLSGIRLLLRGGRVGCGNVPDNAYDQGVQELGVSAGGCHARSLAGARFTPLPAPPSALVCDPS